MCDKLFRSAVAFLISFSFGPSQVTLSPGSLTHLALPGRKKRDPGNEVASKIFLRKQCFTLYCEYSFISFSFTC